MRDDLNDKQVQGIKGNRKYVELKRVIMHNKMKTHELEENSKLINK